LLKDVAKHVKDTTGQLICWPVVFILCSLLTIPARLDRIKLMMIADVYAGKGWSIEAPGRANEA